MKTSTETPQAGFLRDATAMVVSFGVATVVGAVAMMQYGVTPASVLVPYLAIAFVGTTVGIVNEVVAGRRAL